LDDSGNDVNFDIGFVGISGADISFKVFEFSFNFFGFGISHFVLFFVFSFFNGKFSSYEFLVSVNNAQLFDSHSFFNSELKGSSKGFMVNIEGFFFKHGGENNHWLSVHDFVFNEVEFLVSRVHPGGSIFDGNFGFSDQLSLINQRSGSGDSFVHPVSSSFKSEFNFGFKGCKVFFFVGSFSLS